MYKCPVCNFSTDDIVAYSEHIAKEADKEVKAQKDRELKIQEKAEQEIVSGINTINAKIKAYNDKYGKTDNIKELRFCKEGKVVFRGTRLEKPDCLVEDPLASLSNEDFEKLIKSVFDLTN